MAFFFKKKAHLSGCHGNRGRDDERLHAWVQRSKSRGMLKNQAQVMLHGK